MTKKKEKRVTITYSDEKFHNIVAAYAKEHKLSQGEVIEVLIESVHDEHFLIEALIEKRKSKVGSRTSIRSIIERTKGLPSEERKKAIKEAVEK